MVNLEEIRSGKHAETCGEIGVSEVKKICVGVTKVGTRWRARVRDPKLRTDLHLGFYTTPEEAALAVKNKKLEIAEMYKGDDCLSMNSCKGYFNGVKLPSGVRLDNGRWRVNLWHPKLKRSIPFGSYKTCEEAAVVAEMKRAEFRDLQGTKTEKAGIVAEPEMKRANFRDIEKPSSKPNEASVKFERELEYDSPTSSVGADCLNDNAAGNESKHGVLDILGKEGNVRILSSAASVFDAENSNSAHVNAKTSALDFERAVSSGVVNEYGQLLGQFGVLDEQMWLGLPH